MKEGRELKGGEEERGEGMVRCKERDVVRWSSDRFY